MFSFPRMLKALAVNILFNIDKVESVQRIAARFVLSNYSYRLGAAFRLIIWKSLKWDSL